MYNIYPCNLVYPQRGDLKVDGIVDAGGDGAMLLAQRVYHPNRVINKISGLTQKKPFLKAKTEKNGRIFSDDLNGSKLKR